MGSDDGHVPRLRVGVILWDVLLNNQLEDLLLRVGRCSRELPNMGGIYNMFLNFKNRRHSLRSRSCVATTATDGQEAELWGPVDKGVDSHFNGGHMPPIRRVDKCRKEKTLKHERDRLRQEMECTRCLRMANIMTGVDVGGITDVGGGPDKALAMPVNEPRYLRKS